MYTLANMFRSTLRLASECYLLFSLPNLWDSSLWISGWLSHVSWLWVWCTLPSSIWSYNMTNCGLLVHALLSFSASLVPIIVLYHYPRSCNQKKHINVSICFIVCFGAGYLLTQHGYTHHCHTWWMVCWILAIGAWLGLVIQGLLVLILDVMKIYICVISFIAFFIVVLMNLMHAFDCPLLWRLFDDDTVCWMLVGSWYSEKIILHVLLDFLHWSLLPQHSCWSSIWISVLAYLFFPMPIWLVFSWFIAICCSDTGMIILLPISSLNH